LDELIGEILACWCVNTRDILPLKCHAQILMKLLREKYNVNFNDLTKIHVKKIEKNTIIFTEKTRKWCKLPYKNNKKGCPNYNTNDLCPPKSKYMQKLTNKFNHFYLVYIEFNFKLYKQLRSKLHPNWKEGMLGNLLYWQRPVTNILRDKIEELIQLNKYNTLYLFGSGSGKAYIKLGLLQKQVYSMESAGIYVFGTLKNNNIDFEVKPKNKILLVSLLCSYNPLIFGYKTKSVLKGN